MKHISYLLLALVLAAGCRKTDLQQTQVDVAGDRLNDAAGVSELTAKGDTIAIMENIPVYCIYRYPVVQDTLPKGVTRLSNPAVTRLVNIANALKNYKGGLQLVLKLHAQDDDYDRLGYVYFSG